MEAEDEGQAIQLVNQAADKYFVGNAQVLRKLIAVGTALATNSKTVIPANTQLINIVGEMAGILATNGAPALLKVPPLSPPPELVSSQFGDPVEQIPREQEGPNDGWTADH